MWGEASISIYAYILYIYTSLMYHQVNVQTSEWQNAIYIVIHEKQRERMGLWFVLLSSLLLP